MHSLSIVCVNCFILISGYFGIRWRRRSLWNYVYQVLFWTVIAYFVAVVIGIHDFDAKQFIWTLITFMSENWFKLSYLGLFMLSPMLESFIEKSSQQQLSTFILVFYSFSTFFGWILQVSPEFKEGMTFISLSGLYLIGAYIRKYDIPALHFNKWVDLSLYAGISLLLTIIAFMALRAGITNSPYGYLNPLVIVESVYLFLFFKKWNIGYHRSINIIASSAFSVYLFHYHSTLGGLYMHICDVIQHTYVYPFPMALTFMVGVFAISVSIDKVRSWSFRLISRP